MRRLLLSVVVVLAACDPAAVADFDIRPQTGRLQIDSSFLQGATNLGRDFAQRYNLAPRQLGDCPYGAYWAVDTAHGNLVGLNLCVARFEGGVRFSIVEVITWWWGVKGAALRDELADTLRTRYAAAVHSDITGH